jgi:hypothetical protein
LALVEHFRLPLIPGIFVQFKEREKKEMGDYPLLAGGRSPISQRFRKRLPIAGDSIAGTLIAAIAAASESTATTL